MAFTPALIVVDMQNDFCVELKNAPLFVSGALDTLPVINKLLASDKFVFKVATKDWHPQSHVSFASNHSGESPFTSFVTIKNLVANKPEETMEQRLWPDHCVQKTKGAELVEGLDVSKVDLIVEKGQDERVEMYSAVSDSFGNQTHGKGGVSHDLAQLLKDKDVTHVYTVGIAGDYCLNYTALDSAKSGFTTYVIEEAQRCVDPGAWAAVCEGFKTGKVKLIAEDSEEVEKVL
ncbi:NAD(+) salvage pathway protein [Elasticomyces elasticus]|nr:NAD(+) salvage pathway protein [Elasticomyces elasticus]